LRGHDALIITLAVTVPQEVESRLVQAAAAADVPWILPNDWGSDTTNEGILQDIPRFRRIPAIREEIQKLEKTAFISVSTGLWYEWSLSLPSGFGFDFKQKKVTFYDDGETKMSVSTWPQVGRAVARLLSLPIEPENGNQVHYLKRFRNKVVYTGSFTVNQRDMFASVLRVTRDKVEDWSVAYEGSKERVERSAKEAAEGDWSALVRGPYARHFYPEEEVGNTEKTKGWINDVLGISKELLDPATEAGMMRAKEVPVW
jgi:hypothetical protein